MGNYDRRQFLGAVLDATKANPATDDAIFEKYANHSLPRGLQKTTGTLTSYSGVWTQAEVIHLLRRTTFGVRPGDVQTLLAMTPGNAVDYLFSNAPSTAPAPPLNNYYSGGYTDPTGVLPETTWVNAAVGDGIVNSKRRASLKSWWMGVLLNQNCSILEKMNFFWHNHFATQITVIGDARIAYFHHAMLRANALGNFKTFVKEMIVSLKANEPYLFYEDSFKLNINEPGAFSSWIAAATSYANHGETMVPVEFCWKKETERRRIAS